MEKQNKEFASLRPTLALWMKNWYWFVISLACCLGLGISLALIKHTIYKVNASVVISEGDKTGMGSMMGDLSDIFGSGGIVDDEIFKLSAHSVYKEAARDLKLNITYYKKNKITSDICFPNSPVVLTTSPSVADTIGAYMVFKLKVDKKGLVSITGKADREKVCDVKNKTFPVTVETPYGNYTFNKTDYFTPGKDLKMTITFCSYDAAAEEIAEKVNVFLPEKKANVIMISTKSPNIAMAIAMLNKIIAVYNTRGILERNQEGTQTLEFINSRLNLVEEDLIAAEDKVEKFKNEHNILDVGSEAGIQLSKRVTYESQLTAANLELEMLDLIRNFLSSPENNGELIPTTVETEAVQSGITAYNELVLERMKIAHNAKEGNRALEVVDAQLGVIRNNILTSIEKTRDTQIVRIDGLKQHLKQAYGKLGDVPNQESEYRELMRQMSVREQLYTLLLRHREETAMMIANATPRGTIIDEAYAMQRPVSMSKGAIIALAFIFGIVIPIVVLQLRPLFRSKFESKDEVKQISKSPVLGEVCVDKSGVPLVVRPGVHTTTTELFSTLRSNLQFLVSANTHSVVLLTSTVSGEGKSFISINLAASLALLKKKVVLVGMDIRKPRLAEYLNLSASKGVTDYLVNDKLNISDLIIHSSELNFDVITSGPVPPNPSELLMSPRVDELIETLRNEYDYVLIDSAPVGMVSDSLSLTKYADSVLYVCRANYTKIEDIKYLNNLVADNRLSNVAIVVNATKITKGYGYGYGYGHDKKR